MSDSQPSETTKTLRYNVRWMTTTFRSRAQVESLLGPEQVSGNVSSHDYQAAMSFLPGYHRFYGILLGSATLSAIWFLRKPSWSQQRLAIIAGSSALGSLALGNTLTLKSHFTFVRSLENPAGFATALDRIQQKSGVTSLKPSPIISRIYKPEESLHGNTDNRIDSLPPESAVEMLSLPQSPQPQGSSPETRASTKWDQIRAVNAAKTTSSSWDALRQKHEKPRVSSSANSDTNTNGLADDRTTEQAQFDALLEKERNLGSQDLRE